MNYAARVSLDRAQMQVDEKLVNLSPGMAVTVEIKTGSLRIISYLLSPVLRYNKNCCERDKKNVCRTEGALFRNIEIVIFIQ
jgi:hypothetical protein